MPDFDLDALKAERLEHVGERSFLFGGETFALPKELPYEGFTEPAAKGNLKVAFVGLLGSEQAERFWAHEPSDEDLEVFSVKLRALYNVGDPGEPPASSSS